MRGSLTIEAAIMVPLVLFVFAFAMQAGLTLYEETKEMAVERDKEAPPDILKRFYQWNAVEDLLDGADTD